MSIDLLFDDFDRLIQSPESVHRLRRFILDLAVRGKLVSQDPNDEPAAELLKQIEAERKKRIAKREIRDTKPLNSITDAPFNPPSDWIWLPLGQTGNIFTGNSINAATREQLEKMETGRPFIATKDVGYGFDEIDYANGLLVDISDERFRIARSDSVLICAEGGSAGKKSALTDREISFGNKLFANETWSVISSKFVLCVYLSDFFYLQFAEKMTGVIGGISLRNFLHLPFPLPPLAEQHRIVAKVDELMALCDRLEVARAEREVNRDRLATASLARLNAPEPDPATFQQDVAFALNNLGPLTTRPDQIKALRQTILNLAVRGKLVEQDSEDEAVIKQHSGKPKCEGLPANWRRLRLEEFLSENTRNGYSRKPDDAHDGIPILRISAGTTRIDGLVAEEEHKLISGVGPDIRAKYSLNSGDLLACRFNGNKKFVGRMKLFKDYLGIQPIYPDKLIRVRVDACKAFPEFVRIAAESDLVRQQVETLCSTTVGNWGISASNLRKMLFPLPPRAEQRLIVTRVDELMFLCNQLEARLATGDVTCCRLLNAQLHEALQPNRSHRELPC